MDNINTKKLYQTAWILALFTISYNMIEGLISVNFGYEDESLSLFGFGIDSFIEVISGLGVAHMITRIRNNPGSNRDTFERKALRVTGLSFYILFAGLLATSGYNIWIGHNPITTFWGVVISIFSIAIMLFLMHGKRKTGKQLGSDAILADANCTKVCIYMSIILLVSSAVYELTKIPFIDSIGTIGLAYYSFKEGKECFIKAESDKYCSCSDDEK